MAVQQKLIDRSHELEKYLEATRRRAFAAADSYIFGIGPAHRRKCSRRQDIGELRRRPQIVVLCRARSRARRACRRIPGFRRLGRYVAADHHEVGAGPPWSAAGNKPARSSGTPPHPAPASESREFSRSSGDGRGSILLSLIFSPPSNRKPLRECERRKSAH